MKTPTCDIDCFLSILQCIGTVDENPYLWHWLFFVYLTVYRYCGWKPLPVTLIVFCLSYSVQVLWMKTPTCDIDCFLSILQCTGTVDENPYLWHWLFFVYLTVYRYCGWKPLPVTLIVFCLSYSVQVLWMKTPTCDIDCFLSILQCTGTVDENPYLWHWLFFVYLTVYRYCGWKPLPVTLHWSTSFHCKCTKRNLLFSFAWEAGPIPLSRWKATGN